MDNEGETYPDPERSAKKNHSPVSCLHMLWKILTVKIREESYYFLACWGLFSEEQKIYRSGAGGRGYLFD